MNEMMFLWNIPIMIVVVVDVILLIAKLRNLYHIQSYPVNTHSATWAILALVQIGSAITILSGPLPAMWAASIWLGVEIIDLILTQIFCFWASRR